MELRFDLEEEDVGPFGTDFIVLFKGMQVGSLFLNESYNRANPKELIVITREGGKRK